MMRSTIAITICLLFHCASVGCGRDTATPSSSPPSPQSDSKKDTPSVPTVTDDATHLLFSWFENDTPKTSTRPQDVPPSFRKNVRVQDPTVSPEDRDPETVFLVDLTRPTDQGTYPVLTIDRNTFNQQRDHNTSSPQPSASNDTTDTPKVTMYSIASCPVCKRARRWLLDNKITFREIDIRQNPDAAQILSKKGATQGVSTSGVPVFEIRGRLIPGFDKTALKQAIKDAPLPSSTIPESPPAASTSLVI